MVMMTGRLYQGEVKYNFQLSRCNKTLKERINIYYNIVNNY